MKNKKWSLLILLIFTILSCFDKIESSICDIEEDFGRIELLPNSVETIPFLIGEEIDPFIKDTIPLIYKNQMGEFIVIEGIAYFANDGLTHATRCSLDYNIITQKRWKFFSKNLIFQSDSLGIEIILNLKPMSSENVTNYENSDVLKFKLSESVSLKEVMTLLVDGTDVLALNDAEKITNWEVVGSSFQNVFKGSVINSQNTKMDIYYNFEKGLVGFVDPQNILWILDN